MVEPMEISETPKVALPHRSELAEAILYVLTQTKAPMKSTDIDKEVIKFLRLSDEQCKVVRSKGRTQLSYDMAWARTSLRVEKRIYQPSTRYWALVAK